MKTFEISNQIMWKRNYGGFEKLKASSFIVTKHKKKQ